MPTYVVLVKYTDQGRRTAKDIPERVRGARALFEQLGAQWRDWYLTQGAYDALVIADAPDDQTMATLALASGTLGNVHTETMRAFNEQEVEQIIQRIP